MQNSFVNSIKAVTLGHAVADALGVPVEFSSREKLDLEPVADMMGFGTYPYPAGCWSDDTSMSLAALDSLCSGTVDLDDIMKKFGEWYYDDAYTPTDETFDIGNTCRFAIDSYCKMHLPVSVCGESDERSNGNGSLMRIYPFVLYAFAKKLSASDAVELVHTASALTHAHERSKIGCGIYYFILTEILKNPDKSAVTSGLALAEKYYRSHRELSCYEALFKPDFRATERSRIKSGGYVVDTLLAAVWCLLTTESYRDCVLKAVNLGEDTDTVGAIAGSLAGALYGYDSIPKAWLDTLKRREYIENMCDTAAQAW